MSTPKYGATKPPGSGILPILHGAEVKPELTLSLSASNCLWCYFIIRNSRPTLNLLRLQVLLVNSCELITQLSLLATSLKLGLLCHV